MPIMEISVIPVGTKTTSISEYVAKALEVLEKEEEIKYELTSMGTIVQAASIERLFDLAKKMHHSVFEHGAIRAVTTIKIDDRRDKELSIKGKIDAVKKWQKKKERL
jgi:uncharacterized protein (TIGR00106 family)